MIFLQLCQILIAAAISFDCLTDYKDQEVEVRGFLYRSEEGRLVLADEPNLKSCCIGTAKNQHKQLHLINADLQPQSTVAQLSGTLHLKEGRFVLEDVKKIEHPPRYDLMFMLGGLGILGGYLYFKRREKVHRGNDH